MFERLLIANRGEIACRVMRTAKRLGIHTIAVYSDADRHALHVREADAAVHIGPAPARQSYLDVARIMDAVRASGAQALHPGYGFLSENPSLAEACAEAGCLFVGPPADAIRTMGSKIAAKRVVSAAGTPVIPGYQGDDQSPERLAQEAERSGYPVLIKASGGGGGRGMRRVDSPDAFAGALAAARREAHAAFGDDAVLLERYLERPKHVEVQVLADRDGRTLYLFERDCSVQRRHQKVIEEAPCPRIDATLRRLMGEAAVAAARAVEYVGAGTVEFMVEHDAFYFMEMNTRLQVEHPVTEAVLGLDLVEWQLRVAAGEALPFAQQDLEIHGHAMEARLYAENPRRKFLPSTGRLVHVRFPSNARVDTGVETGSEVTMHYDPMIAKVIVHATDRAQARAALDAALAQCEIAGVEHNVPFLRRVLACEDFREGYYDTGLVDRRMAELEPDDDPRLMVMAALALLLRSNDGSPWQRGDAFRMNLENRQTLRLRAARAITVTISSRADAWHVTTPDGNFEARDWREDTDRISASINGEPVACRIVADASGVHVMREGATLRVSEAAPDLASYEQDASADGRVVAPMPGQVIAVHVAVGDKVRRNQPLLVLEAMKMEHTIGAPRDGVVERLSSTVGQRVDEGVELASIRA